jgi:hypothetical protein
MITEISIELVESYSCQFCGRVFNSKEQHSIEIGFYPVCSQRCLFLQIFNFIKRCEFDDKTLLNMQQIAENKEKIKDFSRQSAIYSICKYMLKEDLANIKLLNSFRQELSKLRQELSTSTLRQTPTCMKYKGLSKSCLTHDVLKNSILSKVFVKNGGISKWF